MTLHLVVTSLGWTTWPHGCEWCSSRFCSCGLGYLLAGLGQCQTPVALTFEFAVLYLVDEVHSFVKVVQRICAADNPLVDEIEEHVSSLRVEKMA